MRTGLKVFFTPVPMAAAALLMFIEEAVWEAMKRIMADTWFGRPADVLHDRLQNAVAAT